MSIYSWQPFNELWLEYKNPLVRQLAFTLLSPNIIQDLPPSLRILYSFNLHSNQHWFSLFENYRSRLQYLDHHPDELYNFLNRLKSTRLGLRFETLMWFWLQDHHYHAYELLGHSLQIIEGPMTVGELDFLIKNTETNQIEHWEVALKYYLGEQDLSLNSWYGLNRTDTLFRKLNHFTQKQFQFSNALNYVIDLKYAVLKGQLYFPNKQLELPSWINTERRLGLWGQHFPINTSQYRRLKRHEWLCPNADRMHTKIRWWTDGLYFNAEYNEYYMYKAPPLLKFYN